MCARQNVSSLSLATPLLKNVIPGLEQLIVSTFQENEISKIFIISEFSRMREKGNQLKFSELYSEIRPAKLSNRNSRTN